MISYLKNTEIDRTRWDESVAEIAGVKPYAWSWYLDIMAPGWEALVDDDYNALFPLPVSRKYGFRYIATPVFLQQLGTFSPDGDRSRLTSEFITFIPETYRLVDLCIGSEINAGGYRSVPRQNYTLMLEDKYESLWFNYHTDCRRNINIAHRYPQDIVDDVKPQEVISLFRNNIGRRAGFIRESSYRKLHRLMDFCQSEAKGRILGVRSPKGKLLWGMFVVESGDTLTLLFTAGSRKSRELRTSYHVIDHLIRENAGTGKKIDFAGSSVHSIAMFIRSFGSTSQTYYRLYRNSLPWPVRLLK